MSKTRIAYFSLCLLLAATLFCGLAGAHTALAQEGEEPIEVTLESKFPVLSGESGDTFEAEVDINYIGDVRSKLDLNVVTPQNWAGYVLSSYPEKQIAAVELGPSASYAATETVKVVFGPVYWYDPEPGDYTITLEVSSGDTSSSIDLAAKVTARYGLEVGTETGKLNTEVKAGSEQHFAVKLYNSGSSDLEDLTFTASKPEGWTVTFEPDAIDSLGVGETRDLDVIIEAPKGKTIAGDYSMTITASSEKVKESLDLRVTVLTPSIWGWVGVIIVLVVIAGLAVVFRQMGRR